MPPPSPRYTIEYCEQLLRNAPAECDRLYRKIRKDVIKLETTAESPHRADMRKALADGPKTAMGACLWARDRGNQHIDKPLALQILLNLLKAGEVQLENDKFSLVEPKAPEPLPIEPLAQPEEDAGPIPVAPEAPTNPPQVPLDASWSRRTGNEDAITADVKKAIQACQHCLGSVFCKVPDGISKRDFAQRLRNALIRNQGTRDYAWSVFQSVDNDQIVLRRGDPKGQYVAVPAFTSQLQHPEAPPAFEPAPIPEVSVPVPVVPAPQAGRRWELGHAKLAEVNRKIAELMKDRDALLLVIPMMEQKL